MYDCACFVYQIVKVSDRQRKEQERETGLSGYTLASSMMAICLFSVFTNVMAATRVN